MEIEDFDAIRRQLPALRKQNISSPLGDIPESIAYVWMKINESSSAGDKAALYSLLLSECSRWGDEALSIYFQRKVVSELPNEPLPMTGLAHSLSFAPACRDEALTLSGKAIEMAKAQNRQVKYTLTCQARIALRLGEYRIFNDVLRQLIEDADVRREEDYKLEFDFLDQATSDQIDHELVKQYRALMSQ